MHKAARKTIHELASAYNLSSQSHGSGDKRFTMLFKTSKSATLPFNEKRINAIIRRSSTNFASSGPRFEGGSSSKAVKKHRDGDVVGGDAKEIGLDNRGRVMLEKLGWRSGMGLGAEGMGMKLPVFAVIKASKSGLQ